MAFKTIKLGDFVQGIISDINDNFSDTEARKANVSDIPTKVSQLANDSQYATEQYVNTKTTAVFRYMGTLATHADLPTTGNEVGHVWFISEHGCEWAWQGDHWEELGTTVDLSGYVQREDGKGLTTNDYTTADKNKLAGLQNYTLPVAGAALGGVKSGGNVTINADGTMTAPAGGGGGGATVIRTNITGKDNWTGPVNGLYSLIVSPSQARTTPLAVYREGSGVYDLAMVGISMTSGDEITITSMEKFNGYLVSI